MPNLLSVAFLIYVIRCLKQTDGHGAIASAIVPGQEYTAMGG